jgi:hypothetical protein
MTDEEIHAAAMADPDAQPITEKSLRKCAWFRAPSPCAALKLSQEEFAARWSRFPGRSDGGGARRADCEEDTMRQPAHWPEGATGAFVGEHVRQAAT